MKAIMVRERLGYYEMVPDAIVDDWGEVKAIAKTTTRIESLVGWGEYTAAYRLTDEYGNRYTYFVAEAPNA